MDTPIYANRSRSHPGNSPQTPKGWRVTKCWPLTLLFVAAIGSTLIGSVKAQEEGSDAALTQADAALTEFITSYEARLTADQVTLFRQAQDAWDASRRAYCAFTASGVAEGSIYPTVVANCLAGEAQVRLEVLQTLAQCQEGDLACPAFGDPE